MLKISNQPCATGLSYLKSLTQLLPELYHLHHEKKLKDFHLSHVSVTIHYLLIRMLGVWEVSNLSIASL